MELNEKQNSLLDFVKQQHGDQVRKYTSEPYWTHCLSVAEIVSAHDDGCIEIALCHDLFEDTDCDFKRLFDFMTSIGYSREYAYDVCKCVDELTDKFTKEMHPYLNRAKRKSEEARRLANVSKRAQTVKYADIIDNRASIVQHDPSFAKVYLDEAKYLLSVMNNGNEKLKNDCLDMIYNLIK